ncbi:MAG: leucyl aminopeptidase family protein [Bacteroidales bacterium]|nr:leucyl aminopeptidase family protein [Bacteroidales bacterium]MEE1143243.1 leucyl aminopeptidase family protein [Bacteroidales bacterium]
MISIERLITIKPEVSKLFVFLKKENELISSQFVEHDILNFVNQQIQQNDKDFFAFNQFTQWSIVAIVKENKDFYAQIESFRKLGAKILDFCDKEYIKDLQFVSEVSKDFAMGFVEGMLLASYTFDNYKTDPKQMIHPFDNLFVINPFVESQDIEQSIVVVRAVEKCRDLVNEPYCSLNAEGLATAFVNISREAGIEVEVWHKDKIEQEKMGGLLAVNQGSIDPPTFTIMTYRPEGSNESPLVLVGKGLVYDTGGLNLKPGDYMNDMKEDMAGSAMMATAIYAIACLGLPIHVVGLFPSTDNRPGLNAYASGDIINMYDGTNVEVVNTDAEGRLILADALSYAKKLSPFLVVNAATLTGAAARAVGPYGIAAVEQDAQQYMQIMKEAGEKTYERLVQFPFWSEYDELIKSDIADIKNCGPGEAGMITAGKFLAHFTDYPFIHLDIAGVAMFDRKRDYILKGASGYGVRLIIEFVKSLIEKRKL